MKTQTLNKLLAKKKDGTINSQELELLENWYNHYADTAKPFDNIEVYLKDMHEMDKAFPFKSKSKSILIWQRAGIAAAVAVVILSAGIYFQKNKSDKSVSPQTSYTHDIAPGKQGATLTLANGTKIKLTDATKGELAKQAGVVITKSGDGQLVYEIKENSDESGKINTLETARGQTYQVRLPDGSLVWLNAASSITYSATLAKEGIRSVKLQGEGYFEIAKDKAHPFIVETNRQKVEVLGTHFNVNAYEDGPAVRTTLLQGRVKILSTSGKEQLLAPGEQADLAENGRFTVSQAGDNAVGWKDGKFIFNKTNLDEVLRQISRWYDVDIVYKEQVPNLKFSGDIYRNINISEALEILKFLKVNFKIEGRTVTVTN